MDLQTPLTNHQQCISDLQGRIQAHRAFLLLICSRLFNDANLEIVRETTERRAEQGSQGTSEHFNEGFKKECKRIAERLSDA